MHPKAVDHLQTLDEAVAGLLGDNAAAIELRLPAFKMISSSSSSVSSDREATTSTATGAT